MNLISNLFLLYVPFHYWSSAIHIIICVSIHLVIRIMKRNYCRAQTEEKSEKSEYEQKILKVLRDPEANYDKDQTLIICQMLGFKPGILHLYEENKL